MGSTERSGAFWSTFGTVTSKSEVDKRQLHREQRLHLCRRRTRGGTSATTKTTTATTTNPPRATKKRRRGRIFSIWADGNLRLLHIGLCATEVLCNSRARLLPSLSRFAISLFFFLPFFYYFFFFFSLFRIPPVLTLTYKCMYACASDCPYLSRSIFSFSSVLFLPSLCMMRPTRVYLTPRTTNEESSYA